VAAWDLAFEAMGSDGRDHIDASVRRVQRIWRGAVRHTMRIEQLRREHYKPDIEKARRHAISFLPKDRHGQTFPIWTPFKSFHLMGCGVALYMYLVHWWSALFFVLALVTSSLLFLYLEGEGMSKENLNLYTIHSLGNAGRYFDANASAPSVASGGLGGGLFGENGTALPLYAAAPPEPLPASFGAVEVVVAILLTWFMFWQSNQIRNLSRRITHHDTTAANYTVMVSRMPTRHVPRPEIAGYFRRWGDVVHVGTVCSHRDLIWASRERAAARDNLQNAHVEWHLAKTGAYPHKKLMRIVGKVARAKRRLAQASAAVRTVSNLDAPPTGHVFITFDTVDAAEACIADNSEKRYFAGAGPLQIHMAPEPEDLIWEHLQFGYGARLRRLLLSTVIVAALVIFNTTAISITQVWQQETLRQFTQDTAQDTASTAPSVFELLGVMGVCTGVILFGYLSVLAVVPLLAYNLEKWHQFQNREVNIVLRLTLFQILLPSSCSFLFAYYNDWSLAGEWYATGGAIVLNSLVIDCIIVNLGVDFIRPEVKFIRHVLAPRARTQRQMNTLYKRNADIYLSFRLQLMCKFFVCGLLYSTAFPLLYLLCFGTMAIGSFVDRTNFLRVWAPPPPTSDRLVALVARVIVPLTVLLHTYMAFAFFRAVDLERHTGWSNASTLACVAIGLSTPPTIYFLLRESNWLGGRRRASVAPGPDKASMLRTFREWFLDLKDEGDRGGGTRGSWQPTENFRMTSDLAHYVPPLPRALLNKMGLGVELEPLQGSGSRERLEHSASASFTHAAAPPLAKGHRRTSSGGAVPRARDDLDASARLSSRDDSSLPSGSSPHGMRRASIDAAGPSYQRAECRPTPVLTEGVPSLVPRPHTLPVPLSQQASLRSNSGLSVTP